jgi:hypothetical protein
MSGFQIEHLTVLNEHAEKLAASLYNMNRYLNESNEKILNTKEIEALCKALKDGKTTDQEKFPHLSKDQIMKYGKDLRQPYSVLMHYRNFQTKALDALRDIINDSKHFDISWNYIFVMPTIKLFTNYCRLNLFVNNIENAERVPTVYGYCYKMTTNVEDEKSQTLYYTLLERKDYKKLVAEMQQLQDRFFSIFKSNISVLSRILNAGITYTWKELNLNDNPNPHDKKGVFFRPEYIIMQNLQLLCECYVFFCTICSHVLHDNIQFTHVYYTILAHSSYISLFADFKVSLKSFINKVAIGKGKRGSDLDVFGDVEKAKVELEPLRAFRQRKLAMIMNEYRSGAKYDNTILLNKLAVIHAILGFANFEISNELVMWTEKSSPSVLTLIQATTDLVFALAKSKEEISRFLIYNFREYDGPYLESEIKSLTLPSSNYSRLEKVVMAFQTIDITEYDNGTSYDLSGLEMTLMREMAAFNYFSKSHGIIHLAPLFCFISAIYYRVNLYQNIETYFLKTCGLYRLWGYNDAFLKMATIEIDEYFSKVGSLFKLAQLYSNDVHAIGELPDFKEKISKYIDELMQTIMKSVSRKATGLQSNELNELMLQTKPDIAEQYPAESTRISPKQKIPLSHIPVGKESSLVNRMHLTGINQKLDSINSIMTDCINIGKIIIFGKEINIIEEMREEINHVFETFYKGIKFETPFQAEDKINITKIIFENMMSAALMNSTDSYNKCFANLTKIKIQKNEQGKILFDDNLGLITKQFKHIYSNFLENSILTSFFSNTFQMFMSINPENSNSSQLGSTPAIRVINNLLGLNGVAFLDIIAADTFVNICNKIVNLFESTKFLEKIASTIESNKNDKTPYAWLQSFSKLDTIENPVFEKFIKLFSQLGGIARFRKLLRTCVDVPSTEKDFYYLSKNITPETDEVINQRLEGSKIIEIVKNKYFGQFIGSIMSSSKWSSIEYIPEHNTFTNNGNLITVGIESIIGCIHSKDQEFNPKDVLQEIIKTGFFAIREGGNNFAAQNKKSKFPVFELQLIYDHAIQNSFYLDYSNLEKIIPYQTIRHIYTVVLNRVKPNAK